MKLKTQEVTLQDGSTLSVAVLDQAGNPIYVMDDGMEIAQDVPKLRQDLKDSNTENGARRLKNKELEEALKLFEGIDPAKAKEALETVQNLKDKDFMDAGKVEQLKKSINETWEGKVSALEQGFTTKITGLEESLTKKETAIRNLLVKGAFLSSSFIREKTTMLPEAVYAWLGDRFEVSELENGDYQVVAKMNGEPLFSPANPRNYAAPEEAIEVMLMAHPQKDTFLKASQGSGGGAAGSPGGGGAKSTLQQLKDQHANALKVGNHTLAVALKRQIHEAEQAGAQ